DVAAQAVDLDQGAIVASDIDAAAPVIDVEAMRAAGGNSPLGQDVQVGKVRDKHHRRLTDREKQPFRGGVRRAPARPAGQRDRTKPLVIEIESLKRWALVLVPDAGDDGQLLSADN